MLFIIDLPCMASRCMLIQLELICWYCYHLFFVLTFYIILKQLVNDEQFTVGETKLSFDCMTTNKTYDASCAWLLHNPIYIVIVFHTMSFTSYRVEQPYLQSEFKEHLLPIVNTISYNCVVLYYIAAWSGECMELWNPCYIHPS